MSGKRNIESDLMLVLKDMLEQSQDLTETCQCLPEVTHTYLETRQRQTEKGREPGEPAITKISVGIEIATLLQLEYLLKSSRINLELFEAKNKKLDGAVS